MNSLFSLILDLSLQASRIILAVLVLRKILYRAPKWIRLLLWGIVAFRLVCPLTFTSPVSLQPQKEVTSVIAQASTVYETVSASSASSINTGSDFSVVWMAGMMITAVIAFIQYAGLKKKLETAVLLKDNIYLSEFITSPLVMGISRPHIYLPYDMKETDMKYVLDHEKEHIHHGDHILKSVGYMLVCIHWFNPLVWFAWFLFGKDLELACDERVISHYSGTQRADYSEVMLSCTSGSHMICPLGFGETGVKERIRAVMNYRKPSFWIVSGCIAVCVITAVCFLSKPIRNSFTVDISVPANSAYGYYWSDEHISPQKKEIRITAEKGQEDCQIVLQRLGSDEIEITSYLTAGMETKLQVEKDEWYRIGLYMENSTDEEKIISLHIRPVALRIEDGVSTGSNQYRTAYVGDSSASTAIAMSLPYPKGYAYDHIALQTDAQPYGMTVYLNGTGSSDFQACADMAFNLIDNLDIITFSNMEDTVYASYVRNETSAQWILTIGSDSIMAVDVSLPDESYGIQHADGTAFEKGEAVIIHSISEGETAEIRASDTDGNFVFSASVHGNDVNGMDMYAAQAEDWNLQLQ